MRNIAIFSLSSFMACCLSASDQCKDQSRLAEQKIYILPAAQQEVSHSFNFSFRVLPYSAGKNNLHRLQQEYERERYFQCFAAILRV